MPKCKHVHNQTDTELDRDRTYTVQIRKQYGAEMWKRFNALRGLIRKSVQKFDAFNLKQNVDPRRNFPFTEDSEKVNAFMGWLNQAQDDGVLEILEYDNGRVARRNAWQNKYIRRSYKKGVKFADKELRQKGVKIPYNTTEQDLATLFNKPIHADKVGMLYTRNFNELKGITKAMDQQISRKLANGMAQGWNPNKIADKINDRVNKIGITRARTLARTEVIRAHADATKARYKQYGVQKVEFIWGGGPCPSSVCPDAEAGSPYKLSNVPTPPLHPNCTCTLSPVIIDMDNIRTRRR